MGRQNQQLDQLAVVTRKAGEELVKAAMPVIPFVAQVAASTVAYGVGLAAAQAAGMGLRVSCVTPLAGPIGGMLGVGLASAAAGQASIYARLACQERTLDPMHPTLRRYKPRPDDLLVDALLGAGMFKVMGGRFRSVMPSDVAHVGAIARESLPPTVRDTTSYASEIYRIELARMFRRDGCHHCGTRKGKVIGDHMPPNKLYKEYVATARRSIMGLPYVRQVARALNLPAGPPPKQRYYPQCLSCSTKQSSAVRNDKTVLIWHKILHSGGRSQAWHWAGSLVGLRHYPGDGSGASGAGKAGGSIARRF